MRVATNADKERIVSEVIRDVVANVYLYIDTLIYDLERPPVKVWINKETHVSTIALKYYDSFQIYCIDPTKNGAVVSLIERARPAMISGNAATIKGIHDRIRDIYKATYGSVMTQPHTHVVPGPTPGLAMAEDMKSIAQLICSDDSIGGHYDVDGLEQQLVERLNAGMGRNYVIRQNGRIVGHYGTYAEAPGVAVMSGLIVDKEYRGRGYGKALHCHLSNVLVAEKRKAVLFCTDQKVLDMYLKYGAKIHATYGKLTRTD